MITVRCPNCEATYQLDESKLADGGRKLKCAQCKTVWMATAGSQEPAGEVAREEAEKPAAPAETTAAAETSVPEEAKPEAGAAAVAEAAPQDMPPPDEMLVQRTPGVEALMRTGGWRDWLRGENVWRTGALALIGIGVVAGLAVLGLLYGGGADNVTPMEHSEDHAAPHDATVDTGMVQPPNGVVLHRVRGEVTELKGEQGGVALTVRGLLTNTTSASVVVPAMRLELLGMDGKVADMWPVSNVSGTLEPLAEQVWTVSVSAPDMSSIKGWRVVFVDRGDAGAAPAEGH